VPDRVAANTTTAPDVRVINNARIIARYGDRARWKNFFFLAAATIMSMSIVDCKFIVSAKYLCNRYFEQKMRILFPSLVMYWIVRLKSCCGDNSYYNNSTFPTNIVVQ
jgi:hypothetical protein